jgi:hypothetical protein
MQTQLRGQRLGRHFLHAPLMNPEHALTTTRKGEIVSSDEGGQLVVAM